MARIRVWVFGQVDSKKKLRKLYLDNRMDKKGKNNYVVIRADSVEDFNVDGMVSNVIIPVDAIGDQGLKNAKKIIKQVLKVEITKTLTVEGHIPDPPHISHGFITNDEIKKELKTPKSHPSKSQVVNTRVPATKKPSIEKPGCQHASPGSNKWD
jgi:hypothetical protein